VIELFPPLAQFFRESGGARPLIVEKARRGAIKRGAAHIARCIADNESREIIAVRYLGLASGSTGLYEYA